MSIAAHTVDRFLVEIPGCSPGAPCHARRAEGPEHGHVSVEARRFQGDEKQPAEAISHGRRARALAAGVQPLTMPREFTVAIAT